MATTSIASSSCLQGPAEVLALEPRTAVELLAAVRAGLPFAALEALAAQMDLPSVEIAVLLGIPARSFARRRKTDQLTPQESDRLFRLARTVAQAMEVLGAQAKARLWLLAPNRALGGDVPLQMLDTDIGARQVAEVLLRLSYGVFS
jgi:putative toxin-antitoxin system antitoxin component (TIGR02293 family)